MGCDRHHPRRDLGASCRPGRKWFCGLSGHIERSAVRVALLGPSRHPVVEPYAGGQESYVATLARGLRERGHRVTLFAAPGSDPDFADELVEHPVLPDLSTVAAIDPQLPEPGFLRDQNAFLAVTSELMRRRADFDVVHNNSLHHLPLMSAEAVDLPLVTTLHTLRSRGWSWASRCAKPVPLSSRSALRWPLSGRPCRSQRSSYPVECLGLRSPPEMGAGCSVGGQDGAGKGC
ncbi:glycosyltransferase [Ornithinimicrobium sp. INDO-MA30-4]|uniref:glycosyltransferase n=1 Tax=Ornithinimicrobium sp. INDO-MA30-4 TaxID=2908651 RepID=UPI0037C5741C